jgi:hypothetical protein
MQLIEFGAPLEMLVVPSIGSMAMSNWNPGAELFAFENARCLVLDSFADHDFAANVHQIEHAAHRVARSRVGCFLIAPTKPAQRVEGCRFRRAHKIELNDALDVMIMLSM